LNQELLAPVFIGIKLVLNVKKASNSGLNHRFEAFFQPESLQVKGGCKGLVAAASTAAAAA
jgi:hypothetical protein